MSEHQKTTQAVISGQDEIKEHQKVETFALFLPDGSGGYISLAEVLTGITDRLDVLEAP